MMTTKYITPYYMNKNILVPIALIFIYVDYKLFSASPGILISIFTFFYFSPWLLKNPSILSAIVMFGLVVMFRKEHSVLEFGKFLFMCGSFMLTLHFQSKPKFPFIIIGLFFALELLLRVINGSALVDLYSIKSSGGLFQDSNFTGLFLAAIVASILSNHGPIRKYIFKPRRIFSIVFFGILLLMTFSRTSLIFLTVLVVSKYSTRLGFYAFLVILIIFIYSFVNPTTSLSDIDGSLETKRFIFLGFMQLLSEGAESILFGLGRVESFQLTEAVSGAKYSGHTVFGQIVEYGLILVSLYFYTAYLFIKKLYGNDLIFILIPIATISVTGLSPLSYLGILCFLYDFSEKSICNSQKNVS